VTDTSSDRALRPALLQLVDHRGNVVVVDGDARYAGVVGSVPAVFTGGDVVEVVFIVGFEAVKLVLAVVEGCDARPGAIAVVSVVAWHAAGRRFRPDEEAADVVPAGAGLCGRLEQMSLVDVVQLLATAQRSGVVDVKAETALGTPLPPSTLALARGQLVFARCGAATGEEALFSLLSSTRGSFSVRFDQAAPARNIQRETTFLLLEHLRRLDVAARVPQGSLLRLESVPDGSVVVRPAMSPTVMIPTTVVVEPTKKKKKRPSLPPQPEEKHAPRAGRFARFFDEVSASELPRLDEPPPPVIDDADLAVTDAVRFASFAVTMPNTNGPFDRDTDIVDRALISA
jgi:hypothetical protein